MEGRLDCQMCKVRVCRGSSDLNVLDFQALEVLSRAFNHVFVSTNYSLQKIGEFYQNIWTFARLQSNWPPCVEALVDDFPFFSLGV